MEKVLVIIGILLLVLVVYYISVYNKLTRAKNNVLEGKSGIDIALLKRYDLITDLVEVVKGYANYEEEALLTITSLRSDVSKNPVEASRQLNNFISNLNVTIEAYPNLMASEQYLNLQKNMSNVEEHLQAARRLYNNNVTNFNNITEQFPSNIIAKNHKFDQFSLFETDVVNLVKPTVSF